MTQKKVGSGRKLFSITKRGERALKDWLRSPIEPTDIAKKVEILLLRFAFMEDLVDHEETVRFLESFRDKTKLYIKELKEFHSNSGRDMKQHGRRAFEYGIESYQTTLRWITKTLKTIK